MHRHGTLRHGKDGTSQPFGLKMALQDQPPVAAAAGKGLHGNWKGKVRNSLGPSWGNTT